MFKYYMTFLLLSAVSTGICSPKFLIDTITVGDVNIAAKTFSQQEEMDLFGTSFFNVDLAPIALTITNNSTKQIALLPSSISGSIVANQESIIRKTTSLVNSLSSSFVSQILGFLVAGYLFDRGGVAIQPTPCCSSCEADKSFANHLRNVGKLCYGSAGILASIPLIKRFVQYRAEKAQTQPQVNDILIEPGKSFTTYALVNRQEMRNASTSTLNVVLKENARNSYETSTFLTFQFSLMND